MRLGGKGGVQFFKRGRERDKGKLVAQGKHVTC